MSAARALVALAWLETRRAAPLVWLAFLFAATALAARYSGGLSGDDAELSALTLPLHDPTAAASLHGVARAAAATLGFGLAWVALLAHAAGLARRWRRGDGDWLGARPIGRTAAFGAACAGLAFAALLANASVLAATALAERSPARALVWRAGPEHHIALRPGERFVESLRNVDVPRGAALAVRAQNTALDVPFGDLELAVEVRPAGSPEPDSGLPRGALSRVARRTHVEAAGLREREPEGAPERVDLLIVLTAHGPGTLALRGPHALSLYGPPEPPWRIELALFGRAAALAVALAVGAAALGAWVSAPLAAALSGALALLCAAVLPELLGAGSAAASTARPMTELCLRALPGGGFGAALDAVAAGARPEGVPPAQVAVAALLLALAPLAARPALRSWRHAA